VLPLWSRRGYSKIFKHPYFTGSVAAERLAELQAQFPAVPIVFCETRPLAEEWTYRWLGACQYELELEAGPRRWRKTWGQRQELEFALRTLMPSRRKATEVALSVSSVSTSRPSGSALRSRQRTSEPTLAGRRSHCPDRSAL
jgi:hypothetical protein